MNLEGFTGAVTVDVYNIVGRKVWTSTVNAGAGVQQVDLTSLDAGNYLISASDDAQTLTRRLTSSTELFTPRQRRALGAPLFSRLKL